MQALERFLYIGPNRRAHCTAIEWRIAASGDEREAVRVAALTGWQALAAALERQGMAGSVVDGLDGSAPLDDLGWLLARLAVEVQRRGGHAVRTAQCLPAGEAEQRFVVFEYEHDETGQDAGEIAMRLLVECIPGLAWIPDPDVPGAGFADSLAAFLVRAGGFVLPGDAAALLQAAARLDVPCVKLERRPYGGLEGEFRIRRNGLLKFGHAVHQQLVDGTLCIDRNARLVPLAFDREPVLRCLLDLGLPAPRQDLALRPLRSVAQALDAAQRIGYPVVLKPSRRNRTRAPFPRPFERLDTAEALAEAFGALEAATVPAIVERFVAGQAVRLVLVAGRLAAVVDARSGEPLTASLHPDTQVRAERAAARLGAGLLELTLVCGDVSRRLNETGGAFVDLDPAPPLDRILAPGSGLMDQAAEAFVRWLFPPGTSSRIPLAAITGTNGKTTTSRMMAAIMRTAGYRTGLACTSGVYFDGRRERKGDQAGSAGHSLVLDAREVDLAVLETARGAVAHSGFVFDRCDVAVCTNVAAEHIGEFGIRTLAEMTALKRSILERAGQSVVINADYATCRSMLPFPAPLQVHACSLADSDQSLRAQLGNIAFTCTLAPREGREWLVLTAADGSEAPLIAAEDIPASLGGAARFNLSNAQHAACAAHALGADAVTIREALGRFDSSFENSPGRLNVRRDLPYTVIMDYVHNADGMARLGEVIGRLEVKGRRILLYAVTGNRSDEEAVEYTRSARWLFDHFVVRRYPGLLRGRGEDEIPRLMHRTLLDAGVLREHITLAIPPEAGVRMALTLARAGDLVVLTPGGPEIDRMWQEILDWKPDPSWRS